VVIRALTSGVIRGLAKATVAGAAATAAMDTVWYRRHRAGGGSETFLAWEFSAPPGFDDAPAPAKVAKWAADRFGVALPDSAAGAANNAVHWATGVQWAVVGSVLRTTTRVSPLTVGLATGVLAWRTSYALLPRLGIYRPMREYDTATLGRDLGAHLVFGTALGLAGSVVGVGRRGPHRR
jgi:hypothetical protein